MPVDPILAALDAAERRPPAPPPDPILAALDAVEQRAPFNAPRMATAPPAAAVLPGPRRSVIPIQADGVSGPATVTPAPVVVRPPSGEPSVQPGNPNVYRTPNAPPDPDLTAPIVRSEERRVG